LSDLNCNDILHNPGFSEKKTISRLGELNKSYHISYIIINILNVDIIRRFIVKILGQLPGPILRPKTSVYRCSGAQKFGIKINISMEKNEKK
jgi:hypothetical protein